MFVHLEHLNNTRQQAKWTTAPVQPPCKVSFHVSKVTNIEQQTLSDNPLNSFSAQHTAEQ